MSRLCAVLITSMLTTALVSSVNSAEVEVIYPDQSGRTSPSSGWGSCCGTSTMESGGSSISINSCTYQGGYCMGDSHKAAWIYDVPAMNQGESIISMYFSGTRSGSYGAGHIYMGWVESASLTTSAITNVMSNPDVMLTINWPASASYSFSLPSTMYAGGAGGHLLIVARNSSEYSMNLVNSGSGAARVAMLVEEICTGDFDGSGEVDVADLLHMLEYYGTTDSTCDLDADGTVNVNDLLLLLGGFGGCA